MKKVVVGVLMALVAMSSVAFASLEDTKESIATQYGQYRLVIDTDNQVWTKDDWETKGYLRAKAGSYMYSFSRQGLRTQMEVMYGKDGSVHAQRFTPDMAIKVKDFKLYYPEVYKLITADKAEAFASYQQVTSQFQEPQSPVTMGIIIKTIPATHKDNYTLLAFNIQDEGRLIKNVKFIDQDTYIREFTIERVLRADANAAIDTGEWQSITKCF